MTSSTGEGKLGLRWWKGLGHAARCSNTETRTVEKYLKIDVYVGVG